jgi:hypothetical protein
VASGSTGAHLEIRQPTPAREHQPTRRTTATASRDARTTGLLASKSSSEEQSMQVIAIVCYDTTSARARNRPVGRVLSPPLP